MATVQIDPDALDDVAARIQQYATELESVVDQVTSSSEAVASAWSDAKGQEISEDVRTMGESLRKLHEALASRGTFLARKAQQARAVHES